MEKRLGLSPHRPPGLFAPALTWQAVPKLYDSSSGNCSTVPGQLPAPLIPTGQPVLPVGGTGLSEAQRCAVPLSQLQGKEPHYHPATYRVRATGLGAQAQPGGLTARPALSLTSALRLVVLAELSQKPPPQTPGDEQGPWWACGSGGGGSLQLSPHQSNHYPGLSVFRGGKGSEAEEYMPR